MKRKFWKQGSLSILRLDDNIFIRGDNKEVIRLESSQLAESHIAKVTTPFEWYTLGCVCITDILCFSLDVEEESHGFFKINISCCNSMASIKIGVTLSVDGAQGLLNFLNEAGIYEGDG